MVRIAVSVERIGNEWVMLELQVIKDAIEYHAAFQPLQLLSPHPPLPPLFFRFFLHNTALSSTVLFRYICICIC